MRRNYTRHYTDRKVAILARKSGKVLKVWYIKETTHGPRVSLTNGGQLVFARTGLAAFHKVLDHYARHDLGVDLIVPLDERDDASV